MIAPELLKILCCPETYQAVSIADPTVVSKANQRIASRQLRNRAGQLIESTIEGAMSRADGKVIYPVRNGIPVLLIGEAISLA